MLKTGVCDEYGLNFCTLINCLTCPLMSKACAIKAGLSLKRPCEGTTTGGTKLVNLIPTYIHAILWTTGKKQGYYFVMKVLHILHSSF